VQYFTHFYLQIYCNKCVICGWVWVDVGGWGSFLISRQEITRDLFYCDTLQYTVPPLQHIAIHCSTATHCNTLQNPPINQALILQAWLICKRSTFKCKYTATHCNTLQHTATHCNTLQYTAIHCNTQCNTLQHIVTHRTTMQNTVTHCNTLQHTTTHRSTLHHTATHCKTPPNFQLSHPLTPNPTPCVHTPTHPYLI